MSAGVDMNEYLDLFLQETEEQLTILEAEIGKLEADPTDERIGAIFRAAHTIKGSSRAMGFANYADLTHEFENVLFKVRDRSLTVTPEIADCLVQTVDTMLSGKETLAESGQDIGTHPDLVEMLNAFASGASGQIATKKPSSTQAVVWPDEVIESLNALPTLEGIYEVRVELDETCGMKYVRMFMVISAINGFGEILWANPVQEKIEAEEFDFEVRFLVALNENPADVSKSLSAIGEVKAVDVVPFSAPKAIPSVEPEVVPSVVEEMVERGDDRRQTDRRAPEPKRETNQTIRVDVSLLDNLMNLVGELVIDRTRLSQIGANIAAKAASHEEVESLAETVGHIGRVTSELQEQIMRARMLPIDTVFQRFPRMVRDLSRKLGKKVEMVIEGGETEVDRSVIEGISDPLIHMIRNSVDHGLEPSVEERVKAGKPEVGTVRLTAKHKDNAIWVEIIDDGRGIDADRLRAKAVEKGLMSADAAARLSDRDAQMLIFHSGFSTAKEVTDVSGRGVGMDIVRSNIMSMGGLIDLESTVGVGTRFILKLPLTVAIMGGLLSRVSDVDYVMPIGSIIETLSIDAQPITKVGRQPVIILRGQTVPILKLRNLFKVPGSFTEESADNYVVVVGSAEQKVGLVVDRLLGEQEVVIKSISKYCGELPGLSGATILGNGRVALIVDINSILEVTRGFDNGC
ncbi:MAG: chemotaxis protein CheA [Armatimonadota bacterium]